MPIAHPHQDKLTASRAVNGHIIWTKKMQMESILIDYVCSFRPTFWFAGADIVWINCRLSEKCRCFRAHLLFLKQYIETIKKHNG